MKQFCRSPKSNHLSVGMWNDGKQRFRYVHRLELEAFAGPRPRGHQCGHLDGDPTKNELANLAWVTPKENQAHRILHGTDQAGERHHQAKLTWAEVRYMRGVYHPRHPVNGIAALARRFGVSAGTAGRAIRGNTWSRGGSPPSDSPHDY